MSKFVLYIQNPKPKMIGDGVLSGSDKNDYHFFSGNGDKDDKFLAVLTRVQLDFAGSNGIMLSGFEQYGFERSGRAKYRHQQWWLVYKQH